MSRTTRGLLGVAAGCVLLLAALAGCDAVEGPPAVDAAPPVLGQVQLSPAAANVDTLAVQDGRVRIPLALEVAASAGDSPIQRVAYAVQWQFECISGRLEAAGVMEPTTESRFAAFTELEVPPGRRGAYRVTVWAVDHSGRPSNETATTFELSGTNLGPPAISQIEAPAEVTPPATLRFVVTVEDPDGVDHIARAEVDVPGSGTLPLSDTDAAGNNAPCDGTYSATFTVPAGVEPGPVTFTFRAFDRDGAASEDRPFTVEVLP